MKKLTILIFLPLLLISLSCKKKETNYTPEFVSKGDLLMLVVSDSLEYAIEYNSQYPQILFNGSPIEILTDFQNGYYTCVLIPRKCEMTTVFYVDPLVPGVVDFPTFSDYYPYIDSIQGSDLKKNPVYSTELDSMNVTFVLPGYTNLWYAGGWHNAWNKVRDLKIVHEYRTHFPNPEVSFLCLKKVNGEIKRYFFLKKYAF